MGKKMSDMELLDGLTALADEIAGMIDGEKSTKAAKEKGRALNVGADCRELKRDILTRPARKS